MKSPLFFILLLFHAASTLAQTNYFVDALAGNDANSGTTLLNAWKTIQHACNTAMPNSVVQIKGGTYHENVVVNVSGTNGNPITFRNYQNDSVYLDGTGTPGTTMLQITDKNYLDFRNIVVQNLTVNNAQGILVETTVTGTSTTIGFHRMIVRHINWTGSAATIPTSNDNAQAIIAYGRDKGMINLNLDSCQVYGNILGFSEAVSIDGNVNGFTVKNCTVHDNTNIGILAAGNYQTSSVPATDHARNGIISSNRCFRNVSSYATSGGIYVDGGKNVLIERNTCFANGYGIELGCEQNGSTDSITVRNNLLFANMQTGMAIGGYTTSTTGQVLHCLIRNNTFFRNDSSNSGSGEMDMTKASFCVFENNIFYTNNQNTLFTIENILPQTSNSFNYNCWYTPLNDSMNLTVNYPSASYNTYAAYRSASAQDLQSMYHNPDLKSAVSFSPDLHLLAISPCINKGDPTTVIIAGETDCDGNARVLGGRVDIGAFEFNLISGIIEKGKGFPGIVLYPNPAAESISIQTSSSIRAVEVLGGMGNVIRDFHQVIYEIPVSDLPAGLYFIRVTFLNGDVKVSRFIKV
jgi:hypothetical protein